MLTSHALPLPRCLFCSCSWQKFAGGFTTGALSGVAWGYVCTQILPYYQ